MSTAYLKKIGFVFSLTGILFSCSSGTRSQMRRSPASLFPEVAGTTDGGAVPLNESFQSITRQNGAQTIAYQVESYGGTTIDLNLTAQNSQPLSVTVTGPWVDLAGDALQNPSTMTAVQGKYVLTQPGVYRIAANSEFSGTINCDNACSRPSVAPSVYFQELKAAGKIDAVNQIVDAELTSIIPDPTLRGVFSAKLKAIIASGQYSQLDHLFTFEMKELGSIRVPLAKAEQMDPSTPPPAAPVIKGELSALLGACDTARTLPADLSPNLPGVKYGDYNNMAMSDCQFDRSTKMANILSSLGSDNQSAVSYLGTTYTTPADLIGALIQNGHRVEMRNERTYANFLSFMIGDPADPTSRTAKWPTWVKTGVVLANGQELIIPMGHSQHAWRISGPLVNANITFYLGISGTGFFAQTSDRAGWTGLRALYKFASDTGGTSTILEALKDAATYYKRSLYEASHVAAGMPADGYGFLGVCNDSTALLEFLYQKSVSEYPLVRERSLVKSSVLNDGLDAALAILPSDADSYPNPAIGRGRLSVLGRIAQMTPYSLDSSQMVDEDLRAEMKEVLKENPTLQSKFASQ